MLLVSFLAPLRLQSARQPLQRVQLTHLRYFHGLTERHLPCARDLSANLGENNIFCSIKMTLFITCKIKNKFLLFSLLQFIYNYD